MLFFVHTLVITVFKYEVFRICKPFPPPLTSLTPIVMSLLSFGEKEKNREGLPDGWVGQACGEVNNHVRLRQMIKTQINTSNTRWCRGETRKSDPPDQKTTKVWTSRTQ